jgi:cytoskeleton protein RodZ
MTTAFGAPRVRALVGRATRRGRPTGPGVAQTPVPTAPIVAIMEPAAGAALRAERLRRGLTLDHCEGQLHIRARFLAAIEDDRDDDLPDPSYARIFVRGYATYLGLDATALVRELDRRNGDTTWRQHIPVEAPPVGQPGRAVAAGDWLAASCRGPRARPWRIALAVAILVAALAWLGYRAESRPAPSPVAPAVAGPVNVAPTPVAPASP